MTDEKRDLESLTHPSRRTFVTTVMAGLAVAASGASAAELPVVETNVEIKTPDGTCDAAFIHPTSGSHPGVLIWPDAFGLRPSMRDIGKRLAAEGYSVLVPNPFYRVAKAPVFDDPSTFSFSNPADTREAAAADGIDQRGRRGGEGRRCVRRVPRRAAAGRTRRKKIGTQGYCMGGPLVVRTAAAVPDRIGAGASFHGGGLVTAQPRQPASARAEDQGADVFRHRGERRHARSRTRRTS